MPISVISRYFLSSKRISVSPLLSDWFHGKMYFKINKFSLINTIEGIFVNKKKILNVLDDQTAKKLRKVFSSILICQYKIKSIMKFIKNLRMRRE